MAKLSRCGLSKGTPVPDKLKKTSEKVKIAEKPKASIKPRRAAKKMTKFPETEDENPESIDSGFGESQPRVNHRYPTRARIAALAKQKNDRKQTESSRATPAKPKRYNNPPDVDKENDGSAANEARPRQGTSSNKRRLSGLPVSRPVSQNVASPEELNSTKRRLSQCSSADWRDHIRWLQPRRDIGLWIECTREGCGKWRYAENYHDPLDVPKIWFCEMNTDPRFADCSIPQEETHEAEGQLDIENAYNAGSIVWARVDGFPWWPAMVDDCPDLLKFWDIRGSSMVPYKYHVKFFNEMKIAWLLVRNLKPYAENPRSSFLKKTVFRRKDYSKELDAACEVANQALPLSLLERLKRFSWLAENSGGLCEEDEALGPDEGPAKKRKKTKSTNKSTTDPTILPREANNAVPSPASSSTRTRPVDKNAKKNVTRKTKTNGTENVTGKQTINVRSRIINVETDSLINGGESNSELTGVPTRFTINARLSDFGSQSPSRRDKVSFLEPNELFEGNSIYQSEVDNSNVDDPPVPSPASKSTQSTHETQNSTEESYNPRRTKRVTIEDIAALAKEIRNNRHSNAKRATNFRAATQTETPSSPSLALHSRELSLPVRSDEKFDRSSVDLRSSVEAPADIGTTVSGREDRGRFSPNDIFAPSTSRTKTVAGTEQPGALPWEPIEIDLTDSSRDFEGGKDRRESPDHPNHEETRENSEPSDPTFASISNGLGSSFGSIKSYGSFASLALSSRPARDEMPDRCPSPCGMCELSVDFEDNDSSVDAAACIEPTVSAHEDRERFFANNVFAASSPRPELRHSRSSRESGRASSFRMNAPLFGEEFGQVDGGSEINFSAGGSKGASFRTNAAPFGERSGRSAAGSEINFPAGGSKGASFRTNAAPFGERSVRSADGSETNFPADRSETNFSDGRSEINSLADRSETNFSAGGSGTNSSTRKNSSTSSSREPTFIDLTDSSTDFEGYYDRQEYPDYPKHAETRAESRSFDPRFASTSNRFGPPNTARRFDYFETFKSFGSTALPSRPERNEISEQRSNNSGSCVPFVDLEDSAPSVPPNASPEQDYSSRPTRAASWSNHEPASSKYILNMDDFFLLDILTRSRSSGSGQSSDTIVPSSRPEMDQAFERRPRFPGLRNRLSGSSASTCSLPEDIDFRFPAHSSSECLFEVVTIDD